MRGKAEQAHKASDLLLPVSFYGLFYVEKFVSSKIKIYSIQPICVSFIGKSLNLNFQPKVALKASRAGNSHVTGSLDLLFGHPHVMFFHVFKCCL